MPRLQTDALGRATFHAIKPLPSVTPTAREVRWLRHIARHGPQSSFHLFELTRDTHRCKDTALRQMQKLRAGGFLYLPLQQRATERAEFKPYIYDLTTKAWDHLEDLGDRQKPTRPNGSWWHAYLTACTTSSIDICASRNGIRYIPAQDILALKSATLAIPNGHSTTIPDQLFALDYGGRFRAFALEVDRGTEPKVSYSNRKSWARTLAQYDAILGGEVYKTHYGLYAPLIVLWLFSTRRKEQAFLSLMRERPGCADKSTLTISLEDLSVDLHSTVSSDLLERPWQRSCGEPLILGNG